MGSCLKTVVQAASHVSTTPAVRGDLCW